MKFSITGEHRRFYQEHGYVEFENMLSEAKLAEASPLFSKKEIPKNILSSPRDLWRRYESFRKLSCQTMFAELAHGLTEVSPLRLCMDQAIVIDSMIDAYPPQSLEALVCFEGLASALLLRISGEPSSENPPFPQMPGSGTFFSPEFPINFPLAKELSNGTFFLIAYGKKHCRYVLNQNDPHTYELKKLGYIYGSELNNKNHPLLYP